MTTTELSNERVVEYVVSIVTSLLITYAVGHYWSLPWYMNAVVYVFTITFFNGCYDLQRIRRDLEAR